MKSDQKRLYWEAQVEGWCQSTLSQKDYCKQHKLTFSSFGYWRTRLNRLTKPTPKFIPVKIPRTLSLVNLYLPNGLRLEIPPHTLAEVLSVVSRSIQESA